MKKKDPHILPELGSTRGHFFFKKGCCTAAGAATVGIWPAEIANACIRARQLKGDNGKAQ